MIESPVELCARQGKEQEQRQSEEDQKKTEEWEREKQK
jgi:hypothetical protein